jgi:hypothetical protein
MIKAPFFAPRDGNQRFGGFFLVNFLIYRKEQQIRSPLSFSMRSLNRHNLTLKKMLNNIDKETKGVLPVTDWPS